MYYPPKRCAYCGRTRTAKVCCDGSTHVPWNPRVLQEGGVGEEVVSRSTGVVVDKKADRWYVFLDGVQQGKKGFNAMGNARQAAKRLKFSLGPSATRNTEPKEVTMETTDQLLVASQDEVPAPPTTVVRANHLLKVVGREAWLRREQPKKPGETARYRVTESQGFASIYRNRTTAEKKLAEAAVLLPDVPAEIVVVG